MQNINYTFQPNSKANSTAAMQWVAAHAINALWKSAIFNSSEGIYNSIPDLNIWVSPKITSDASTPMLRYTANKLLIVQVVDVIAGVVSAYTNLPITQVVSLLKNLAPDITLNYVTNDVQRTSEQLNNTFLHELGHSVHYAQVGASYWASYISYVIQNNYDYGDKTTTGSERIAIAEGWGYFIGNYYTNRMYRSLSLTGDQIADRNLAQLENQVPDDNNSADVPSNSISSSGWIIFGLFYDAIDTGEPTLTGVNDAVNGFNVSSLYNSMPSSVTTVAGFRQELLNRSPAQTTQINQLFQSYRY